jgi:hypothetical protein
MKKFLIYTPLVIALVAGLSLNAYAGPGGPPPPTPPGGGGPPTIPPSPPGGGGSLPGPGAAPEIDPGLAAGALTLLSGALMVARSRRSKR